MKVSVVTICFNAVKLIENTILSVAAQTYPEVEYIVIDGASTDGTRDLIILHQKYISYWISEPDKGIYDAMNKGIAAATGDYIIFMNAGDTFTNNRVIENAVPYLGHHTVVTGHWCRKYADGTMKNAHPKALEAFKIEMPICHQATFVRLSYHKKNPFDTSFRLSSDYDFFYKAWCSRETFLYIDNIIADFLEADGVSSSNITESVMERAKSWRGERYLLPRLLNLRYQICRIKMVKLIKSIIATSRNRK